MRLELWATDGGEDLLDWLSRERGLRGLVRPAAVAPPEGTLGVPEVIEVAVGAGGALSVLAASLKTWFAQPRREKIRIVVRNSHGESVEIDADRVDSAESILRAFLEEGS